MSYYCNKKDRIPDYLTNGVIVLTYCIQLGAHEICKLISTLLETHKDCEYFMYFLQ